MNRDEFIQKLESSLKSQRIVADGELVEYVNDEHTGELGPFRKFNRFFYQHEWRLVGYDGSGEPRKIQIGSIRDISVILPSDQVNKEIKVHFEPAAPPDRKETAPAFR